jgi:hypothetical protein
MLCWQCDSYAVAAGGLYLCAGIIKVMIALHQQVRWAELQDECSSDGLLTSRQYLTLAGLCLVPSCFSVLSVLA